MRRIVMTHYNSDCGCAYESRVNHIKCEVKDCVYHSTDNCCHASLIEVAPHHSNGRETMCATFKAEQ